jgi:arylsulfatase A-like enzyme
MVHRLDSAIGNVTAALSSKGMWEQTLLVFSSDNGGREDAQFGGNNWPLRGMKFSAFEGGTRVAAFVSGGALPPARRGQRESGLMHVADWWATFAALAGAHAFDLRAAAHGLPPVDALDHWPTISTGAPSVRTHIMLTEDAFISWPYKIVQGKQGGKGIWTGPKSPNATKVNDNDPGCDKEGPGCLFNIDIDEGEHIDLAMSQPALMANITAQWQALQLAQPYYQTNDTPNFTNCTHSGLFAAAHSGFGGPVCYNGSIPWEQEQ